MLVARATGQSTRSDAYEQCRDTLLANPSIRAKVPRFVVTCATLDEFWGFIQPKFAKYRDRRKFIIGEFEPLLLMLDSSEPRPDRKGIASARQRVLDIVADFLILKHTPLVRGVDLRQELVVAEVVSKRQLILQLVPKFLRMAGTAADDSYSLTPIGGLQCYHSAIIRGLAHELRHLVVEKYRQDRNFDSISWEEVRARVQCDDRALTQEDFEVVNFVFMCLGVWGGNATPSDFVWSRPHSHHLENLLDVEDTDRIFLTVHRELLSQAEAAAALDDELDGRSVRHARARSTETSAREPQPVGQDATSTPRRATFDPKALKLRAKVVFLEHFADCDRHRNVIPDSASDADACYELVRKGLAVETAHGGAFLIGPRGIDVCMEEADLDQILGLAPPPDPTSRTPTTVNVFQAPVAAVATAPGASARATLHLQQIDDALQRVLDLHESLGHVTSALIALLKAAQSIQRDSSASDAAMNAALLEAEEFRKFQDAVKPGLPKATVAAAKTVLDLVPLLKPALSLLS